MAAASYSLIAGPVAAAGHDCPFAAASSWESLPHPPRGPWLPADAAQAEHRAQPSCAALALAPCCRR